MDNCRVTPEFIKCLDPSGKPYAILFGTPAAQDLVCFKAEDFEAFDETCHN